MQSSDAFAPKYSELIDNGFWFPPERVTIQAPITETQRGVTRVVSLGYTRQHIIIAGRKTNNVGSVAQQARPEQRYRTALETAIDGTDTAVRATKSFVG